MREAHLFKTYHGGSIPLLLLSCVCQLGPHTLTGRGPVVDGLPWLLLRFFLPVMSHASLLLCTLNTVEVT